MIRYAIVRNSSSTREVRAYLPDNYRLLGRFVDGAGETHYFSYVIAGEDVAGWGLDSYVRPRLASGLMSCEEIAADHEALKIVEEVCVFCGMGRSYHGADKHPFNGPVPGHGPEHFNAQNGDYAPPPESLGDCVICGEAVVTGPEMAEMYEPADPDRSLVVDRERSGLVHASCGTSRGWEVA